jgi:3-hydroxyisobutyrate dehydrogenase-like beta-hydroxyacid dehydrogenase
MDPEAMERTAAILYPGEMGAAVGTALVAGGWTVVTCLEGRSARTVSAAAAAGITAVASLEAAVAVADVVVSLVPQTAVVQTAAAFAAAVARTDRRPLYLDANSVSPATMAEVRAVVEGAGCDCVDGAFVGSAKALGQRTTLYLSGGRSEELASLLGDALKWVVLGHEVGAASAFKLAFAGFNKGLVALFLEVTASADRLGLRDALLGCLRELYPGTVDTVARLLPSYPRHAARRVEEMDELVGALLAQGSEAAMAAGTRAVLARFAALGLDAGAAWDLDDVLDACSQAGFLGAEPAQP